MLINAPKEKKYIEIQPFPRICKEKKKTILEQISLQINDQDKSFEMKLQYIIPYVAYSSSAQETVLSTSLFQSRGL